MVTRLTVIENQREYCRKMNLEYLLHNGFCPKCGEDIANWLILNNYQGNEGYVKYCPYCGEMLKK